MEKARVRLKSGDSYVKTFMRAIEAANRAGYDDETVMRFVNEFKDTSTWNELTIVFNRYFDVH